MDRHIFNKFQFIEDRPKVEAYRFFTNFTIPNRTNIKRLPRLNKLKNLTVSIYGHDLQASLQSGSQLRKSTTGQGENFYRTIPRREVSLGSFSTGTRSAEGPGMSAVPSRAEVSALIGSSRIIIFARMFDLQAANYR